MDNVVSSVELFLLLTNTSSASASDEDMQLYIVLTRLACIAFSTAAFVLAMAAPVSRQFWFVVSVQANLVPSSHVSSVYHVHYLGYI